MKVCRSHVLLPLVLWAAFAQGQSDRSISELPPWPNSPSVALEENADGLLVRAAREYELHEEKIKWYAEKFNERITKDKIGGPEGIRAQLPDSSDLQMHEDLIYARYGKRALLMDVYRPRESAAAFPAVIFVHAGGWNQGTRKDCRAAAMRLAKCGYATATVEYRLAGEAPFPAAVYDLKAAVRYLRAHSVEFQIDPKRIAITGSSAGGHLSLLTAYTNGKPEYEGAGGNPTQSSELQAVVSFYGGTDFCAPVMTALGMGCAAAQWIAVPFSDDPHRYIQASPVHQLNLDRKERIPPSLFVSGVPEEPSLEVISTMSWLKRCGVYCETAEIRAPHGFLSFSPYQEQSVEMLDLFLKAQLKP